MRLGSVSTPAGETRIYIQLFSVMCVVKLCLLGWLVGWFGVNGMCGGRGTRHGLGIILCGPGGDGKVVSMVFMVIAVIVVMMTEVYML